MFVCLSAGGGVRLGRRWVRYCALVLVMNVGLLALLPYTYVNKVSPRLPPSVKVEKTTQETGTPQDFSRRAGNTEVTAGGDDMGEMLKRRRSSLSHQCHQLNVTSKVPAQPWLNTHIISAPGPLQVCITTKIGSRSWRQLLAKLRNSVPSTPHPIRVLLVRHPLARLASAYR
ncbi:hypothetical protein Hamer_G015370 [Homarus americanus]|uniref:Carbohydrate sulfotransferase n=1 Tax=Homarus americanus TaxID=6706 RepID=A0A8J5N9M5_HOMAM|nr:hypothetical protein Hamer_G015370 [Homarus americanus]